MSVRAVIAFVLLMLAAPARAAPPNAQLALLGSHLYGQYCIACHGANGTGIVRARSGGSGPLRDQSGKEAYGPSLRGVGALSADFYLRTGYMPLPQVGIQPRRARVLFSGGEIDALVAYVASLGGGPAIPKPQPARGNLSEGMRLFTEHCAGCHQVAAEGGYVTGGLPPPLGADGPVQIAQAVRIGPWVMPRFSEESISRRQLDSIIAYVQYAKHPDNPGGWSIGRIGPVPEGLATWFIGAAALVALCVAIGERLKRE
ncbi:MAG: c-type cytochrome [Gaiellaceae bacterium]